MGIHQTLQGIKVKPLIGPSNGMAGEAFNGFITDADCNIGFNGQSTEINLSLVHDSYRTHNGRSFDPPLNRATLSSSLTQPSNLPNGYRVEFLGSAEMNRPIAFEPMFLFSYDTSLEPDSKTSSVVLKDYSVILDKIYIGLSFRQYVPGPPENQRAIINVEVRELCNSCGFDNKELLLRSKTVERTISMFSCFFDDKNKTLYGNQFASQNFSTWEDLITLFFQRASAAAIAVPYLDDSFIADGAVHYPVKGEISINGGSLFIGTEQFNEAACGNVSEVDYSFSELLASLVLNGLNVRHISFERIPTTQNTPNGAYRAIFDDKKGMVFNIDRNPKYRQNYTGTLSEVLGNWCSDMALNFHFYGTELVFTDSSVAMLDINTTIKEIYDNPDFREGNPFVVNSYKVSASLAGTTAQGLITSHIKAQEEKSSTKQVNYLLGYLPLHPISFYVAPPLRHPPVLRQTVFGEFYSGPYFADPSNLFSAANGDREWYTNRLIRDIDDSIALAKYNPTLRNILCGKRYVDTKEDCHLGALGFFPLYEFQNREIKQTILNEMHQGGTEENQQNIVLLQEYFKILVGYHYPKLKGSIIDWEKNMARDMYSYGALLRGTDSNFPFVIDDKNTTPLSSAAGDQFQYTSYFKLTKSFSLETKQYSEKEEAPFKGSIPNSGFALNTGYYIAKLDNHWGTEEEEFDKILLELSKASPCNSYLGQNLYKDSDYEEVKPQNWSLEDFEPKFYSNLDAISADIQDKLRALRISDKLEVEHLLKLSDLSSQTECKKLFLCIIPLTDTHPNIRINFTRSADEILLKNRMTVNQVMLKNLTKKLEEEKKRLVKEDPESPCDISLQDEVCSKGVIEEKIKITNGVFDYHVPYDASFNATDAFYNTNAYGQGGMCRTTKTDKTMPFEKEGGYWEGFAESVYRGASNSRYLTINITRNPNPKLHNVDKDGDGIVQLSDYISLAPQIKKLTAKPLSIVYPIGRGDNGNEIYYQGLLMAKTTTKTKFPDILKAYGAEETFSQIPNGVGVASVKIVNQVLSPEIESFFDPKAGEFSPRVFDLADNQITNIDDYHKSTKDAIKSISRPLETVDLRFGGLSLPTDVRNLMTSIKGLSSLSLKVGENGEFLEAKFNSRPAEQPKQEVILNKIKHRTS